MTMISGKLGVKDEKLAAYMKANDETMLQLLEKIDPFFNVEVFYGSCTQYPDGVYVVGITPKKKDGKFGRTKYYPLYKFSEGTTFFSEVLEALAPASLSLNRDFLQLIVTFANELAKRGEVKEVEEEDMINMLENALDRKTSRERFDILEEYMSENPEGFASLVDSEKFDLAEHDGVLLNIPKFEIKYGKYAVGVKKDLLYSLFVSEEHTVSRASDKGSDHKLIQILKGWAHSKLLFKKKGSPRYTEVFKGISKEEKAQYLYIVNSKLLYKAFAAMKENNQLQHEDTQAQSSSAQEQSTLLEGSISA